MDPPFPPRASTSSKSAFEPSHARFHLMAASWSGSFPVVFFPVLSHQGSAERENRLPSLSSSMVCGSPDQRMTRIYTIIHYMERTRVSMDVIARNPDCLYPNNIRGSFACLPLCLIIRATDNHLKMCERSDIDVACATRSRFSVE